MREVNAEFTTIRQNYEARIAALQTDLDKVRHFKSRQPQQNAVLLIEYNFELQAAIAHTAEQDAFEQHKAALDRQMEDVKAKFRQREAEIQKQYDVRVDRSVVHARRLALSAPPSRYRQIWPQSGNETNKKLQVSRRSCRQHERRSTRSQPTSMKVQAPSLSLSKNCGGCKTGCRTRARHTRTLRQKRSYW